jgi:hypothetical protein
MVLIDGLNFFKSERKNKKLKVYIPELNKFIHFGDSRFKHYYDSTEILDKSYNHLDKKRRDNYLKRSGAINKGQNNEYPSANFFSRSFLW